MTLHRTVIRFGLLLTLLFASGSIMTSAAQQNPLEQLRRQGIDVSDPEALMRAARQMGLSESQIQDLIRQQQSGEPGQQDTQQTPTRRDMTPEQARAEAQRYGIDLTDPRAALRRARTLGLPVERVRQMLLAVGQSLPSETDPARDTLRESQAELVRLPEINPSPIEVQDQGEAVTVMLTLNAPTTEVEMRLISPDESDTLFAGRTGRVSVVEIGPAGQQGQQQPRRQTFLGQGGAVYDDARYDQRGAYSVQDSIPRPNPAWGAMVGANGRMQDRPQVEVTWLGTILVPPTAMSGTWTLSVVVRSEGAAAKEIAPAAVVKIESPNRQHLEYFGYKTFRNVPDSFQPGAMGPVSDGYVVGPNDELRLTVWGAAEFQYDLPVDAEGRIYVPKVGQLTVAGKTIDELRGDLRNWLSRSYAGLVGEPPSVMMDLTVTRMRPLQIFVLGEVENPGGYQVASGSSIFSALYSVGGPLRSGSLRRVRVARGDRMAEVDLYDYLLKGIRSDALQLQTGDNVFIPARGKTVSISGAVKRPAIYEMTEGETFRDLLGFAGGLQAEAYTKRFQIERIVPFSERQDPAKVRTLLDYNLADVLLGRDSVRLEDGDQVRIFSIMDEENIAMKSTIPAVYVEGAVFSPGRYEIGPQLRTVRDLIERADGLTGAAYRDKAELVRVGADLEKEIISIDLTGVLQDAPTENLVLRPQDSLKVYSKLEMQGDRSVRITGRVREPGTYEYYEGMTIRDLLFRGGGLRDSEFTKDVFMERADLFRTSPDGSSERIIPFDLTAALEGLGMADELLLPEDEIRIYAAEVEEVRDRWVVISGAVKNPGEYQYRDDMTVEDLILQAGGFEEDAYTEEVEVTRALSGFGTNGQRARQIEVPLSPSFTFTGLRSTDGIQLAASGTGAVSGVEGSREFELQHRDLVFVREIPNYKEQATVAVTGEVQFPGEYTLLHENESLASILRRAGGTLPTGYARGGRLKRNGEQLIVEMDDALDGDESADVIMMPGDSIHIPLQPNTVAVRGNVANEGLIKYVPGQRVDYYLERAGGAQDDTESVLLTQASGATFRLERNFFGILPRRNPVVDDGATIRVTVVPPSERDPVELQDVSSTLRDVTAILSTTVTLLILSRELSN